jgi:putative DNA primase/helicase
MRLVTEDATAAIWDPPDANGNGQHQTSPPLDDDRATELANAEEVRRLYGRDIRYDIARGQFLRWVGTHWKPDEDGYAVRCVKSVAKTTVQRLLDAGEDSKTVRKFASRAESAAGVNGVLSLLKTEEGVGVTNDKIDADNYALNVANGTLNLRTGQLRAHRREDLITRFLPTPYDPNAQAPRWLACLHRCMDGKAHMIDYLNRLAGLCLTGDATVQELFIPYGAGANGKSLFFDTLIGLLGPYADVAPDSLLMVRHSGNEHPTEIADLLGKRLVVASETESGSMLRLQLVKRLTGDKKLKGRFMRCDYISFPRTHKLILITNSRPRLPESTEAVWRRLRVIPFSVVIPAAERDEHLLQKLEEEFAGILAWAVRGCLAWQRDGMKPPTEVQLATADYREEADELADFLAARCIIGDADTFRATRGDLFAEYLAHAKAAGEQHPLGRTQFYDAIRRRDGITEDEWKNTKDQKVRGFKGIGISVSVKQGNSE